MFVHAKNGNDYRVDDVQSASYPSDGLVSLKISGVDDEVIVDHHNWDRALSHYTRGFCQAQPCTYILWLWFDQNGVAGYNKTNVIGWSMGADGYTHAITVDGVDHGLGDIPPILHPDGRVEDSFDQCYDNVEEWFAAAKDKDNIRKGITAQ